MIPITPSSFTSPGSSLHHPCRLDRREMSSSSLPNSVWERVCFPLVPKLCLGTRVFRKLRFRIWREGKQSLGTRKSSAEAAPEQSLGNEGRGSKTKRKGACQVRRVSGDLFVRKTPATTRTSPIASDASRVSLSIRKARRTELIGTMLMNTPALEGPIPFIPS